MRIVFKQTATVVTELSISLPVRTDTIAPDGEESGTKLRNYNRGFGSINALTYVYVAAPSMG